MADVFFVLHLLAIQFLMQLKAQKKNCKILHTLASLTEEI